MCYGCVVSTITVKHIPPAVHRALKARAAAHGRSLNKEIIATLEGVLRPAPINADNVLRHARAVREIMGVYVTSRELAGLKNAGRK